MPCFSSFAPGISDVSCRLVWGSPYQKSDENQRKIEGRNRIAFDVASLESMICSLQLVPVVLVVMWRSGEGWNRFGLVKPRVGKDIVIGLAIWLMAGVASVFIRMLFHTHNPWSPLYAVAVPAGRALLLVGRSCAIGFAEELTLRAYLIPRVESLTNSTWTAICISVIAFAFGHIYLGQYSIISSAAGAVIFSIAFCVTRRLWPVALAHAIHDFVAATHAAAMLGG